MGPRPEPEAPTKGAGLWPPPKDAWLPLCGVALLFAGHWFYGALISDAALMMGMAVAVLLGAILLHPRLRDDLLRLKGLALPAGLFALVLLVGHWTLTPWTPGGPHPIWAYAGVTPGASTIDKSATIVELIKLLGLACFFLVGAATGARDERARFAIRLTLLVGLVFGLWAFFVSVTGAIYQTQGHRLEAHFMNPNTAGTVFAVFLMLCVSELVRQLRTRSGRRDVAAILPVAAAALTFAVCVLATASRGALMGLLGGGLVFVALQLSTGALKLTKAVGGLLAGLAALLVVVLLAGDRLVERLFASQADAVLRTEIWKPHWAAFLDSPLFGYGLGTAETMNRTMITGANVEVLWNIRAILNVYLQWLEEGGLLGAVPMFLCLAALIFLTLRGTLRRSRMTGLLAALLAVDAIILIHGATDFALQVTSVAALWSWLLGLQFSLAQGTSRR